MWISRVRITGGFLNGLDVSFSKGLNVVVGARGSGKTTLLELIRHAVGAKHADERKAKDRQKFLDAVLGSGEVIVDIQSDDGGRHIVVDAKGGGQRADLSDSVLVLGQSELEGIASDAESRLHLIDLRIPGDQIALDRTPAGDLTAQMFEVRERINVLAEEAGKRKILQADRDLLSSQEAVLVGGADGDLALKRDELKRVEAVLQDNSAALVAYAQAHSLVTDGRSRITIGQESFADALKIIENLPQNSAASATLKQVLTSIEQADRDSERAETLFAMVSAKLSDTDLDLRGKAAPIRAALEEAEAGLGQITAELRNVDAELQRLAQNDILARELSNRLFELSEKRSLILDNIENSEGELYSRRLAIANATTSQIANNVLVVVDHYADAGEYRQFLIDQLRGSSVRTPVVDAIAYKTLPRQLLELVEAGDTVGLSVVAELNLDQASRVVDFLNNADCLSSLGQMSLTDKVDFRLQDGSIDKSIDSLSTGQKCAVTLPIILSEPDRTLILDQPEDHLDNAYLVKHVVQGMIERSFGGAQTIVATHNANIPVLGSADTVVVLTSDGQSGSVVASGPFGAPPIVDAITSLMEGGRTAFATRYQFYAGHGGLE